VGRNGACGIEENEAAVGDFLDGPEQISLCHGGEQMRDDGRCSVIEEDFFKSVPDGADTYLFRQSIHDWNDEMFSSITIKSEVSSSKGHSRAPPKHLRQRRTSLSLISTFQSPLEEEL
jgi:hypothetical protein